MYFVAAVARLPLEDMYRIESAQEPQSRVTSRASLSLRNPAKRAWRNLSSAVHSRNWRGQQISALVKIAASSGISSITYALHPRLSAFSVRLLSNTLNH
jgi:hypothetical protein